MTGGTRVAPEHIQKLMEERESLRTELTEREKACSDVMRKERQVSQRIEAAWVAQNQKIVNTIKALAGE